LLAYPGDTEPAMHPKNVEILEGLYEVDLDSNDWLRYLHQEVELYPGSRWTSSASKRSRSRTTEC
jgi:hypothetical protein